MRAVEPRGTIAVKGKINITGIGSNSTAGEVSAHYFERKILQPPCLACGSDCHSLLQLIPRMEGEQETARYKRACTVSIIERIYKPGTDKLDITFGLPANRFARDCNYDLALARRRLPSSFLKEGEGIHPNAESFYNEVRRRCLSHAETSEVTGN